eukprot:COSAG01_NODE_20967_length_925_cov_0.814770_1_plen_240_part_01
MAAAATRGARASAAPSRRASFAKVAGGQAATSVMEHTIEFEAFESLPCAVGNAVDGPRFEAGGHEWYVSVRPGGNDESTKAYVAVFLHYAGTRDGVSAHFTLEFTHSGCPRKVLGNLETKKTFATNGDASKGWVVSWGDDKAFKRSALAGKSGTLTVKCVLSWEERRATLVAGRRATLEARPLQPVVMPSGLGSSMKGLLDAGTLSDVVLQSAEDQTTIKAHRVILAARSAVFAAMFTSG